MTRKLPFIFLGQLSDMKCTGLWDIKYSEGHIYAALKIWSKLSDAAIEKMHVLLTWWQ